MTGPKIASELNPYHSAPRKADWTVDQRWHVYTHAEHERWDRLVARQNQILPARACDAFLDAKDHLRLSQSGIPDFASLSRRLSALTGWTVVPVAGLVPDPIFFAHLANRRFPAGAFIRPEQNFDYLSEPDVFHDIFGHVPMLAVPEFADFMVAYGEAGLRAAQSGHLTRLARLYWYTVEFGLVQTASGLRIFGAGILSSPAEAVYALTSPSPARIVFDLERTMRTRYIIDDFQRIYCVIDSLEGLLQRCTLPFAPIYDSLLEAPDLEPGPTTAEDRLISA